MSSYHQESIQLKEAMTMELRQGIRIWSVDGCHVKREDIPKNTDVYETFVMKFPDDCWQVGIQWTIPGKSESYMGFVAEFSSLEEVQNNYSTLFELIGCLIAFG